MHTFQTQNFKKWVHPCNSYQYPENFFLNQSCYSYTLEVTRILTLLELCIHIHVHSTYTFIYSMYSFVSDFFIQHGTCEIHPYYHVHQYFILFTAECINKLWFVQFFCWTPELFQVFSIINKSDINILVHIVCRYTFIFIE